MISVELSTATSVTYRSARSIGLPKFPGIVGVFFLIGFGFCASGSGSLAQQSGSTAPAAASPQLSDKAAAPGTVLNAEAPKAATSQDPVTPALNTPDSTTASQSPTSRSGSSQEASKIAHGSGSSLIPHDLSPYGMFMNADIVVKVVMVGLAFASLVTWTILLVKTLELFGARRRGSAALTILAKADTLRQASGELDQPKAPVSRMAQAALAEIERSRGLHVEGVKERAAALLGRIEARAGRTMGRGTGVLATIGSTAPFVGLFGTVWGIMNSFIGISRTNTTNLAVVAPGIAEALLATACGLVAAIPAVIIYNMFARGITGYRSVLGDASTEILRLLSRDLDRASESAVHAAARRQAAE